MIAVSNVSTFRDKAEDFFRGLPNVSLIDIKNSTASLIVPTGPLGYDDFVHSSYHSTDPRYSHD